MSRQIDLYFCVIHVYTNHDYLYLHNCLIQIKEELLVNCNLDILVLTRQASGAMTLPVCNSTVNKTECMFSSIHWTDLKLTYGLALIIIALIWALILVLTKKTHSPSSWNSILIIETLILLIIGVTLHTPNVNNYVQVIAFIVPCLLTIFAMILGQRLLSSAVKWRILLFSVSCVLAIVGMVSNILSVIYKDKPNIALIISSFICWCAVMFTVIALTIYYLFTATSKK
ncbi:unnamed protein product [Schistosoma turkestanicum]|nr:unnamed protein product [Schistosoma turkestanicum]